MAEQLLLALAQVKPGIEILMGPRRMVTVRVLYWPRVAGIGPTLLAAAQDCAYWMQEVANDHPDYYRELAIVFRALDACEAKHEAEREAERSFYNRNLGVPYD